KVTTCRKTYLTREVNEAGYHFFTKGNESENNMCWVHPSLCIEKPNGECEVHPDIFEITHIKKIQCQDSYTPIYNQIIGLEAIEMHKLQMLMEKHNGTIL